jgi:hypothetical protein
MAWFGKIGRAGPLACVFGFPGRLIPRTQKGGGSPRLLMPKIVEMTLEHFACTAVRPGEAGRRLNRARPSVKD